MKRRILVLLIFLVPISGGLIFYINAPFVSHNAVNAALAALRKHVGNDELEGTLMVVDYSQPSHTKRMAIMELRTGAVTDHSFVAHGRNSGVVFAEKFSNSPGSLQSSLGLFRIAETFDGEHGTSLRLIGLEPNVNNNARKRGIIVHAGDYVSRRSMLLNWKEGFRLGRSEGCFVLNKTDFDRFLRKISYPAYLYSYAEVEG
jgi:hypothetical protein